MSKRCGREGWVYWALLLVVALLLALVGWPIARRVLLHRDDADLLDAGVAAGSGTAGDRPQVGGSVSGKGDASAEKPRSAGDAQEEIP